MMMMVMLATIATPYLMRHRNRPSPRASTFGHDDVCDRITMIAASTLAHETAMLSFTVATLSRAPT
jgi:hypothetical protein